MAQNYLSKFIVSLAFDEESQLNLTPYDMGESMLNIAIGETTGRAETAVGSVATANIAVTSTISVSVKKTSPSSEIWSKQIERKGVLLGNVVATDDVGKKYTLSALSVVRGDIDATATNAEEVYTLTGNYYCNADLAV